MVGDPHAKPPKEAIPVSSSLSNDIATLYGMTKDGEIMLSEVSMDLDAALKDGIRRGWLRSDGIRVWATRAPEQHR